MQLQLMTVKFILSIGLSLAAFSQAQVTIRKDVQYPGKIDAATRSNNLIKAGGFIKIEASGAQVRVVNAQGRIPLEVIQNEVDKLSQPLRYKIYTSSEKIEKGNAELWASQLLLNTNVASVIVVIDEEGRPPLVLAPEARWAILNVKALESKTTDNQTLRARFVKEFWRTYGFLMGGAYSDKDTCVMLPVFKPEDLDSLKLQTLGVEAVIKMRHYATSFGINPMRMQLYRKACEEGWAPKPTNELQRAVWEDVEAKKAGNPTPPATK